MLSKICPKCSNALPDDDINDSTAIAFCRNCNLSFNLSELNNGVIPAPAANLTAPPPGAWYRDDGMEKVIGATCRSIPAAIATGFIALLWNAPVSMFLAMNLMGTLGVLGVRMPEWVAFELRDGASKMPIWLVCFLWLFMMPFIALGGVMIDAFLAYLYGQVEVSIADGVGSVTTPLLGFKRRRPFNPTTVRSVWIKQERRRTKSGVRYSYYILIELPEGKPIKFGSDLREDRRNFVAAALNSALGRKTARRAGAM